MGAAYGKRHCRTADDVAALIPRDAFVVCGGLPGAPEELLRAMCRRMPELGEPTLYCGDIAGKFSFLDEIPPEACGRLRLMIGGGPVPTTERARVDLSPWSVYEVEQLIAGGRWAVDVCLITARPPNADGDFVLSPQVACLKTAATRAGLVLAEIDDGLPRLLGDTKLGADRVDAFVAVSRRSLWESREAATHPTLDAIGRRVAELVPDGACIQVGIGSLAEAVLANLGGHSDLAVHSGFIGDGVRRLMEKGVVTGTRYPLDPGKVVTGALLGGKELYDFADGNERIALHPFSHVNNPAVVARIPDFFAINSAVSVDLFGQAGAEGIGGKLKSGGGGQMDFMPGAHVGAGGTAIITLQATASRGTVSRIVAPAFLGGPVTSHRNWVDIVVTEFGVADLRGLGVLARAARLIEVADPRFRDELSASMERVLG